MDRRKALIKFNKILEKVDYIPTIIRIYYFDLLNKIYDDFEKQFKKEQNANLENEKAKAIIIDDLRRENARLKKQLANNHHIECMCSFCKPVEENVKEFVFTSCDDCKHKKGEYFQEECISCKRYYGCYFEKKEM